jgi:hypothetical protein
MKSKEYMPYIVVILTFAILALSNIPVSSASSTETKPATFGEASAERFKLQFDESDYDLSEELIVRCGTRLEVDGSVRVLMCEAEPERGRNSRKALRTVQRLVKDLTLEPARVDGIETQVWYNFAVVISPGDEETLIVNNHLYSQEKLGRDYSAPQRYDYPAWRGCIGMPGDGIHVRAEISSSGEVLDVDSIGGRQGYASCVTRASMNVRNSKFIPAVSNGVPVKALFVELFK